MASALAATPLPNALAASALLAFIHALEQYNSNFLQQNDCQCAVARYAEAALREAEAEGGGRGAGSVTALEQTLADAGWDGRAFAKPLDAGRLASRLKSFLFVGLRQQGCGTYALVFRARSRVSGKLVALKRMKLDSQEEGVPTTALREVSLLRQLAGSPHIVQ